MAFAFRKKRIVAARTLFHEANIYYDLATQADSILLFLDYWNAMKEKVAALQTYKDRIPSPIYDELSLIEYKEYDFQWKLRDAIERVQNCTILDLKFEHRNNKQNRFSIFLHDINRAKSLFSKETEAFANAIISNVATIAGVEVFSDNTVGNGSLSQDIDSMDGAQFELWCAELLSKIGFSNVSLTGKSGDQGVDLLAQKDGIKYAIQCKCYSSDLGNTPVQEVNTGKIIYNCHVGAVLTNRHFTAGGKEAAKATGVLLWDRDWIKSVLEANKQSNEGHVEYIPISAEADGDDMLPAAVDIILETGQASVSTIQRELKLGYARAARIMDEMEEYGLVGPYQGSKPRAILISKSQWASMKSSWITNRF